MVDSCIILFNLNIIMQLKQFYNIATKVSSRKSADTFGDLPDCWVQRVRFQIIEQHGCVFCERMWNGNVFCKMFLADRWQSSNIPVKVCRMSPSLFIPLRWRHNEHDGVLNHQPYQCLLNRLFRRRSKKIAKLRVTGLCAGNSQGTGEFLAQMASNAENVSILWRHHVKLDHP